MSGPSRPGKGNRLRNDFAPPARKRPRAPGLARSRRRRPPVSGRAAVPASQRQRKATRGLAHRGTLPGPATASYEGRWLAPLPLPETFSRARAWRPVPGASGRCCLPPSSRALRPLTPTPRPRLTGPPLQHCPAPVLRPPSLETSSARPINHQCPASGWLCVWVKLGSYHRHQPVSRGVLARVAAQRRALCVPPTA